MKNRLFLVWWLCLFCVSCGVEEVMKLKNNLNVILLETVELPEKHVGDTVSFKVFAGTNDVIKRMEITRPTHDFSDMLLDGGVRYEIIEDTLYTDSEGYFNRPVSSVVVNYPIIVNTDLLRQIAGLNFTFHTDKGVSASAWAQIKVVNYLLFDTKKDVFGLTQVNVSDGEIAFQGYPFYASGLNQTYPFDFLTKEPSGQEDVIEGEELIEHIDMFQYQEYSPSDTVNYFYSPDRQEVQKLADRFEIVYHSQDMRHTVFMVLPKDFDFDGAKDPEIDALDFSGAEDFVTFEFGDNVAFLTEDGYRGIMSTSKNVRTDGTKTPVIEVKRQTVPDAK